MSQYHIQRRRALALGLTVIFCNVFAQVKNTNPFIGKWKRCIIEILYPMDRQDPDSVVTCDKSWTYHFLNDSVVKQKGANRKGRYIWGNGMLIIGNPLLPSDSDFGTEIIWRDEDHWYYRETVDGMIMRYYWFEKVK